MACEFAFTTLVCRNVAVRPKRDGSFLHGFLRTAVAR